MPSSMESSVQPVVPGFLFLMGYRGSGKSTVGRILAKELDLRLIDTDQVIQEEQGKSIREIFEQQGESGFREMESKMIRKIVETKHCVVSLGGGSVLREENRGLIRAAGRVVWLNATVDEIFARISSDSQTAQQRPALSNLSGYDEIAKLVESREPIYREMADLIVSTTGRSAEAIAEEIRHWWTSQASPTA